MKKLNIITFLLISMFSTVTFAAPESKSTVIQNTNSAPLKEPAEFQKVIEEYKSFVAKIPAEIREEIIAYRKEIAKMNKEKRLMYKKLSQESQDYLKQEQEYKKRLPLNRKALINVETPGEKSEK